MKLSRLLANACLLTLLNILQTAVCQDDKGVIASASRNISATEVHGPALNINSQIGSEVPSSPDDYEDEDDLELQASEHEIEAVYSALGGGPDPLEPEDKTPKKPKRRRRRRRRRKRIRTSTSSYEDVEEKNSDLGDLPPPVHDMPPPPEVISYPRRKPNKRRRKTTTPIPIEEEYLLSKKGAGQRTTAVPLVVSSHRPENIEEIIEQEPQDSFRIKQKINNLPVVIPTESLGPVKIPLPTTVSRNTSQEEYTAPENFTESLDTEMLTPHGKQNKINIPVNLSEPILFVTAPQGVDFTALSKATPPVKIVASKFSPTTNSPIVNVTSSTSPKPIESTTTEQPTKGTNDIPKNTILKKIISGPLNSTREITSTTEKSEAKKNIRRPPSVNTLFRKRFHPTVHTTTSQPIKQVDEITTVSRENELAELKLYTESPLEIQKVEHVKLNEIPPTSKVNTFKPLKDSNVHEKDLGDNSVFKKDEFKLKYIPTSPAPVKHTQTSGTRMAYTPNIDLIIDYTASTRKPTTTDDEYANTISTSHSEESKDEAVRINLEIPQVKDDILIFLKSKAESNKLSKILQSRNMTLNELIEHRERGSSQLHLAEIFKSEPKAIPEADFDIPALTPTDSPSNMLGTFPTSISQQLEKSNKEERREPKFLFDSLPQFPLQAEASQTVYTTKKFGPELHYTRTRPLLPNTKLTPFYGSSEELLLSYTSSTGRPTLYANDEITIIREHDGNRRISSELKSVITISGAIIAFAVLAFFVLLISCKVRHRKAEKYLKHGMLREHMRETLRSSTRSDTPVVKNGYYAGCDHTSDTSSTARQTYLWKTIRKTFRYE